MIEDNQKEKWRVYNTSREFSKDLKFNRKWYHLIAIFDQDRGEDFDFNNDIEPGEEFDFNQVIEPIIYSSEDFVNTDEIDFDFNSPLMEKYKITEIGLIMSELNEGHIVDQNAPRYDIKYITNNNNFINFYNAVNNIKTKGFYVKTGLMIFSNDDVRVDNATKTRIPNEVITDETEFNNPELSKNIFSTILKAGGGYTNEATLELLGNIYKGNKKVKHESYSDRNMVQLLSSLTYINHTNANKFPDAIFDIKPNDVIPVDLKVAYSNDLENEDLNKETDQMKFNINVASSDNYKYMTNVYRILCEIINDDGQFNTTLIQYINDTKYSYNGKELTTNKIYAPELKGFLLMSSTAYNPSMKHLEFSSICMRSIISCLYGRNRVINDMLFASKSKNGQGAVKYDNGSDAKYEDKNSILYQCPERFANVIKNFYIALHDNPDAKYNNAVMLRSFVDGIDNSNIEKIYNAIMGIKNDENLSEK